MITATTHDKGAWFDAPPDVVGVEVDRTTGGRATEACRRTGQVAFEYFAHGTEPIDMCPLHAFGVLQAVNTAPTVTGGSGSRAGAHEQASVPEPAAGQVTTAADTSPSGATSASPSVEKKRGFWARVFGKGRDDKKPAE
jgi:hypothetical protein